MKHPFKLILSVVGCELVGILGTPFTLNAIPNWYAWLNKPFFAPPNWIFGPVWTVLYALMGFAFYELWKQGWHKKQVRTAAAFFLAQLTLNFIWTPIFFGLRSPEIGLVVILAMWVMIGLTLKNMYPVSKVAVYALLPYWLWVSFATLLNAAIVVLN
jgi:tryptophan-rich sensory protein